MGITQPQLGNGLNEEDKKVAVALMANGLNHILTNRDMAKIHGNNAKDAMISIDDGSYIRFSAIGDIVEINEYYKQNPDKAPNAGSSQPPPRQFSADRQIAVQQLIEDFQWTVRAFNFQDLQKLVLTTWAKLEAFTGSFEEFCLKHKAITPEGAITTAIANIFDDKGKPLGQDRVPFAYPFFSAIRKAIETVQAKEEWEASHTIDFNKPATFDTIITDAPPTGVAAMLRGLDKYSAVSPLNTKAKELREKMLEKLKQTKPNEVVELKKE